jgi:hypothetical protein
MNIESLEINLLKASEIKDGDVVIVKIDEFEKANLDAEKIRSIYKKITDMLKKETPIYFFPSNFTFEIMKDAIDIQNNQISKENKQ